MAGTKPAGAQDKAEGPQTTPEALELERLRAELEAARKDAESARARADELDAALANPRGTDEAPEYAPNDRLADVLEMLGTQLAARGVDEATFKPGESAGDVMASLEGRVSQGDHSGRYTEQPVVFLSRGRNLRVIRKARIRYSDARGEVVVTEGIHYPFEPDGRFETDDAEVVEYLESRPSFGSEFWQMGADPHREPSPQPVLDTIMDAMLDLDDARLADIERVELEGLKRELVLNSVAAARRKVQGLAPADDDAEVPA